MLFALISLAAVACAARAGWLVARLWQRLPRSNADFNLH